MAFVFNKVLNSNNFADDSFGVSPLVQTGADLLSFAYSQPTSLDSPNSPTSQIYAHDYTMSTSALGTERAVSGSDGGTPQMGYFHPCYAVTMDYATRFCGYNRGGDSTPWQGFTIKESADGITWGSSWSGGGSYDNDMLRGIYRDIQTGDIYAVTNSSLVGGFKVNVHKRTGAGTWSSHNAFTGTNTNFYPMSGYPNQHVICRQGYVMIVGSKQNGSIYSLVCVESTLTDWTERAIIAFTDGAERICKLSMATADNKIRLMVPNFDSFYAPSAPTILTSNNFGTSWQSLGVPPGLLGEDADGHNVTWPYIDGVSFIQDGRARMYLLVPDIDNQKFQVFRAWSDAYYSWQLVETNSIVDGSSNPWNPNEASTFPSSALVVGTNIYRVACAWLAAGYVQAWMLKDSGAAISSGGRTGGGGLPLPRTFSAGD